MAEQRFTNGSVNLKAKKRSQSEGYPLSLSVRMQEENLYEEMNVKNRGTKQTTDTNDKRCACIKSCTSVTACWGILLLITALRIYFTTLLIHKNEDLMRSQLNLTAEIQNLTEQIKLMKKELSLCPEKACQEGWLPFESSCYAINDAKPHEQKTWEEARKNCKGKISDLAVVINAAEKKYISEKSWGSSGNKGYWIGLRVEGGKWKWVDGSYLTDNSWIQQPPSDGLCVISVENQGFKSVSCDKKNQWICKKRP
ncbi:C-type lectin domain family 4 member G isoform X3 [Oreochromis niloticus]|nr:C-type lectin domain family 4 member G isoform X3 [Oreochromis niloticus]XP_019220540.1 C-type lectin domain family 4 member G isoform X3 [Oreochromis niloticus]XP_025767433.1 C-type lectin domain family 4 member G isoform X3 [Oreochromis niloticus]